MNRVRALVFAASATAALAAWWYSAELPTPELRAIRAAEICGFLATVCLYLALVASPLYAAFPGLPSRAAHLSARRALGVSCFAFALAHTWISFFDLLAGWRGIDFLTRAHLDDLLRSTAALLILGLLAFTSTDWALARLGHGWKLLHRLVYVAALLVLVHLYAVGSHYVGGATAASVATVLLVGLLVTLEGNRIDAWMVRRFGEAYRLGLGFALGVSLAVAAAAYVLGGSGNPLSVHGAHPPVQAK